MELKDRVAAAMEAAGLNQFELDRLGGFAKGFTRDLLIGRKVDVYGKGLVGLSLALDVDIDFLVGLQDTFRKFSKATPLKETVVPLGVIQSGTWNDIDLAVDLDPVPMINDPRYPAGEQGIYLVNDDALNQRGLERGMAALVLSKKAWEEHVGRIRDGLIVVCRRTRDEGTAQEISARIVRELVDRVEFVPDSTNMKHKSFVSGEECGVVGVVLSATRVFAG